VPAWSRFCTWSYKPREPLACVGPSGFISHGGPCSMLHIFCQKLLREYASAWLVLPYFLVPTRGVVHAIVLPASACQSCFLLRGWCAFVQVVHHTPVPIWKGGCIGYFVSHTRLSSTSEAFQTTFASSFCIRTSPQNFFDTYPTILLV